MKLDTLFALAILISAPAFAGSASRDCQTADGKVMMGAGNSSNLVKFKYVDSDGKEQLHEAPVKIMPTYDYNAVENELTVTAIPAAAERVISTKHEDMHVVHQDGSECYGRERWDDRSVQTYVLTGKDAQPLTFGAAMNPNKEAYRHIKGLTPDGYIVAQFQCRDYGMTTAGGCFPQPGDKVTWEKSKE